MNLPIPKKLWKETYLCASHQSADELRSTMTTSFDTARTTIGKNDLEGAFYAPYSFRLNPKWYFGSYGSFNAIWRFRSAMVFLEGEIFPKPGKTLVRVTIRPNIIAPIQFFLMPVLAVVLFFVIPRDPTDPKDSLLRIFCAALFLVGPLLMYLFSVIPKQQLRKKFLRTFALEQLADAEAP